MELEELLEKLEETKVSFNYIKEESDGIIDYTDIETVEDILDNSISKILDRLSLSYEDEDDIQDY